MPGFRGKPSSKNSSFLFARCQCIAQAKEEIWDYATPPLNETITTAAVSLDGAYVLMREDGYREAMLGNISLYDVTGKRQHTIYIGEAPEYGKGTFFQRLEKEIST